MTAGAYLGSMRTRVVGPAAASGSGMVGSLAATRLVVDYQSEGDTYDDLLNER